jgi:hypothetical protein
VRLAHRTFAHSSSAFPLPAARADSPIGSGLFISHS